MNPHFLDELRTTFAERGAHTAVVHQGREYSFAELDRRARHGAALLQQRGMQKGDRVVLATPAKFPFLIAHLSILYGGGVSLPLNPRFTREELRHLLSDSEVCLAVVG